MASVAAESSARSSTDSARPRNIVHTHTASSTSQESPRNQPPTSHYSNQDMVQSVTDNSTEHTRAGDRQFGHSRVASQLSSPHSPFDALTPYDVNNTRGRAAAPTSQSISSPAIASTDLCSRILKWSMETKISIFQIICAVLGLGVTILFGVYALKQGNTSIQVGDRSLAISMWQACMQFPTSPATQSSKWCQENLNNTLENLQPRSSGGTRPRFILEPDSIPSWILLPNDFDRSTCYMVCEGFKLPVVEMDTSTMNSPFNIPSILNELTAGIAIGSAQYAEAFDFLGSVLSLSGGIIFAFYACVVKYPRRVNTLRQLPSALGNILMRGKKFALLGRVMTFSAMVSHEVVLRHPEGQKWVGLLLYPSLILFLLNYGALQYYSMECWIFFETMIHFMLILPTSIETALGCLLIYGPFYVFLWDYLNIFQWQMRRRRITIYISSIVLFVSFTLLTWQTHIILLGLAASLPPSYYLLEQVWWWNELHLP